VSLPAPYLAPGTVLAGRYQVGEEISLALA
jgi:hypothetical protein